MIASLRKTSARLYESAVIWALVFTAVRTGGNLLVLPLLLRKLSAEELGLWYVFLSISGISAMIDLGFSPTMTRVTAFIWAGAQEIPAMGVPTVAEATADPVAPNYRLLANLVKTMRLYYLGAGVVVTAILASAGTLWVMHKTAVLPNARWLLAAWIVFLPGVLVNTTSGMWHPLLSGINKVKLNQQIMLWGLIANYVLMLVGLLAGWGLMAPVAGYLVMGVLSRGMARAAFRKLTDAAAFDSVARGSMALLRILWPTAWRTGVVTLGLYATINLNTLICSVTLGLKVTASYGLSLQLALAAVGIATTFVAMKIPLFAQMQARGEVRQISLILFSRMRWFWVVYVGLSLAAILFGQPVLTNVLHARTPLLSPALLAGLFVVIGLEGHHAIFREVTLTSHQNPFAKPVLISAALIVGLSFLLVRWLGIWALVLAPGLVQVCFNNWWTVLVGLRSIRSSVGDYARNLVGLGSVRPVSIS